MRVLIAGSAGLLGTALCRTAPSDVALATPSRAQLDIADRAAVRAAIADARPDLLINAAGFTAVDRAESTPDAAWRANRDGAALLADAAAETGVGLVHIGTDYIFDGAAAQPYAPDHPPAPLNIYGASKAAGEDAIRRRLPAALVVRAGWLYDDHRMSFPHRILERLRRGDELRVVADQRGTPTHAESLAAAIWALARAEANGIFHFADGGTASWHDFALAIQTEAIDVGLLDARRPIAAIGSDELAAPARRPAYSVLDCRATYDLLGVTAVPWRERLRRHLAAAAFA